MNRNRFGILFTFLSSLVLTMTASCEFLEQKNRYSTADSVLIMNPEVRIARLPGKLRESSGLLAWNGLLWTINDSGGKNKLYGFHPSSGAIIKEVWILNASNHDWEALADDDRYIFIGDVGNNKGNRKDLKIYRIEKESLRAAEQKVYAEVIAFSWADQDKFTWIPQTHPYDCEAMVAFRDSLFLFTKNWFNGVTKVYAVPKDPGNYTIHPIDSFNMKALVTDADMSPDGTVLVLTSYFQYIPSLWVVTGFNNGHFFSGRNIQLTYPDFYNAQTEGVAFWNNDSLFVSAEKSKRFPQAVYQFDLRHLWDSIPRSAAD